MATLRSVYDEEGDQWVRELRIDGEFIAAWSPVDIPPGILLLVENALQEAFEHGKVVRSREIKKLIG